MSEHSRRAMAHSLVATNLSARCDKEFNQNPLVLRFNGCEPRGKFVYGRRLAPAMGVHPTECVLAHDVHSTAQAASFKKTVPWIFSLA